MDSLRRHEVFEIEVLERLKNAGFLHPLVFSGGTMLRLCYDLRRYSTDLDFWFLKKVNQRDYYSRLKDYLAKHYELTDSQAKFYTLLFEIRSPRSAKRLKIEIRRKIKKCDYEEKIAFSPYANAQVILRVHTLAQMAKNKISAAMERKDIRDFFDLEFLLRRGAILTATKAQVRALQKTIASFKERDYKVSLGSLLEPEQRRYYIKNKFDFLKTKLKET